jgi:acyl dehydratase
MIGTTYQFSWNVERGKVREFLAAIGDKTPIYMDSEEAKAQGYPDTIAPPTFTTVPIMWSGKLLEAFEQLKIPLSSVMHAEQGYEFYGAILPGDTLTAVMEIKSITERIGKSGALDFILFETTFMNQDGQPVVKEQMLVVERK